MEERMQMCLAALNHKSSCLKIDDNKSLDGVVILWRVVLN